MERLLRAMFRLPRSPRRQGGIQTQYYTERAKRVLTFAHQNATSSGSTYIEGIHFVSGLLQEGESLGVKILRNLLKENFDPFVQTVSEQLSTGVAETSQPTSTDPVGLSEEAKEMIMLTDLEARRLKHHYVGTEHQLLGILRYSEQEDILPVFKQFGVTHEKAVEEVKRILIHGPRPYQERMRQVQEKPIERFLSFARSMDRWGTDIGVEGLSAVDSETQQQLKIRQIKALSVVVEIDGQPSELSIDRIQRLIVENPNPPQTSQ